MLLVLDQGNAKCKKELFFKKKLWKMVLRRLLIDTGDGKPEYLDLLLSALEGEGVEYLEVKPARKFAKFL